MSRKTPPENSPEAEPGHALDAAGLAWALGAIHDWRRRIGDRTRIDPGQLGRAMLSLAAQGVPPALLGFVLLGCEWLFRLRAFQPADVEHVLAQLESRLLPVLHDLAWTVIEALAPQLRKQLTTHRVLAPDWEDLPREVFVATEPAQPEPAGTLSRGYLAPLRTRPTPLIRARRGPPPKLAPWMTGVIADRLRSGHLADRAPAKERDPVLDLVSALCGRTIDKQEYVGRRRRLQGPALDQLVEEFTRSHALFVSLHRPASGADPGWFGVVRARLAEIGPRETFPYDRPLVARLVEAAAHPARPTAPRSGPRRSE